MKQTKTDEVAPVSKEDGAVSDIVIERAPTKDEGTTEGTKSKTEEKKTKEGRHTLLIVMARTSQWRIQGGFYGFHGTPFEY